MKQGVRAVALGIACFALGAAFQRLYDARRLAIRQTAVTTPPPESAGRAAEPTSPASIPAIRFEHEPLWAYGFETPPAPSDKALPQNPPTRNLRPGQDPVEQTRPRHLDDSTGDRFGLLMIRGEE